MQLDPIAVAAGVRLEAHETIGSTNEQARKLFQRGVGGPLWVTAVSQTRGYGRHGRVWSSPPGNLYASLLLSDPSPIERAPELAFVAALAVRDAIVSAAPTLAPQLAFKWPNDLLLAGEKCAGVLIEGEVTTWPVKSVSVVIGIGVNCAHHPPSGPLGSSPPRLGTAAGEAPLVYPATDLRAGGADVAPAQLFQVLSATMCQRVAQWDIGRRFSGILGDWLRCARGIGDDICVRDGRSEKTGRFVGLDRSGRLMLDRPGFGVEWITAGDIFPFAVRGDQRVPSRQD